MWSVVKNTLAGLFIGFSNVVPGVSGGTIACVFGTYEEMISLPSIDIRKIKKAWREILCLYVGIGVGILAFSKLISFLYARYEVYTRYFFVGLIFGSLLFLYEEASEKKTTKKRDASFNDAWYNLFKFLFFALSFSIMFALFILQRRHVAFSFFDNTGSMAFYLSLFFVSALASAGMIIPGISGAFLLLLFGAYRIVIDALSNFDIKILAIVGMGVLLGAFSAARLISYLIKKFRGLAYSFILGLTLGSIINIFPIVCQPFMNRFISAMFLLLGYVLVTILTRKEHNNNIQGGDLQ